MVTALVSKTSKDSTIRRTRSQQIIDFFYKHTYQDFNSADLHSMFGTSFRSRISEINRNRKSPVRIVNNRNEFGTSTYYARVR